MNLVKITCNKCGTEKDKDCYSLFRYTCKDCIKKPDEGLAAGQKQEANRSREGDVGRQKRMYKNGSWATLDVIQCSKCNESKEKGAFKENRYICKACCNDHMKALNERKGDKYVLLQKEYNARYEKSEHGMARRTQYRQKLKEARGARTRKTNPINRMRIHLRRAIATNTGRNMKMGDALQYLGTTPAIFKTWVEYNFDEGMTWDTLGSTWKIALNTSGEIGGLDLSVEKNRYEVFNWRNWCPVGTGREMKDCRQKSVEFFSTIV